MKATRKPLFGLTAADLMSRQVVLIPREMSLRAAARLLTQARISGAPIVDDAGRCLGVISVRDIALSVDRDEGDSWHGQTCAATPVCSDWQVVDDEKLPNEAVSAYMSTDLVTTVP